jgi:predicted dehydrogenase
VSPVLKSIGETEIIDELRVIISEEERTTAYFTFSSQMKPSIHEVRVYGSKNGLALDQDHDILLKLRGDKYKSYADKFVPPAQFAKQYLDNLITNVRMFLSNDFHMDSGMKYLMESFYNSIREGAPVPIPYREILLTTRIMGEIFEKLVTKRAQDQLAFQATQFQGE